MYPLRLQKFLARSGVASRRGSEDLITAGRVRVNGLIADALGTKVDPNVDRIEVDGILVSPGIGHTYLMLNKPAGYLTTMDDPQGRPTVKELVACEQHPGLFPVGRLDQDTTGLLLFMTDGELAHQLLHPRHHVAKRYRVCVDGIFTEKDADRLRQGIKLNDGMTLPALVEIESTAPMPFASTRDTSDIPPYKQLKKLSTKERLELVKGNISFVTTTITITITEGRKRQIKRMCTEVGHPVLSLHRESFGTLTLGDLEPGTWRYLSIDEQESLKEAVL